MKKLYLLLLIITIPVLVFSQKKTTIKENNIKSIVVYEYEENKDDKERIESVTVFDNNGNIIEEKEYNKEGRIKNHMKYEYDSHGRTIKEIELDEKGKVIKTEVSTYKGEFKDSKITYDDKNNIIKKKRYQYTKY